MYLSRLLIDPVHPQTARTLAHAYLLHQAVMAGFDPADREDTRVLFRVEPERCRARVILLVQSRVAPQWNRASARFFGAGVQATVKPLRLALQPDQRLRFRLRANPTVKREGKRLGLYGETAQREWLERKLESAGAASLGFRVVDEGLVRDRERGLQLQSALYDGVLRVRDASALLDAVSDGIGSGKGFGFGLLSLARAA